MVSGIVFDVKRFAVQDGPGLRTTVFLKGCPLSCLGCHNPEGQAVGPELVFRADRCTLCGDCVPACPHQAISLSHGVLEVAWNRCELAGACVEACLPGALEITGRSKPVREIVHLLEDDRIYYDESGGGVTISGGEPFTQPDFLKELLLECRDRELAVFLDTCGHVAPETFREIAPLASGLLFDLKVMDESRHEAFTGVHNRWILENLRWAAAAKANGGPDLTVRIPLIPGINDDEENLKAVGDFLKALDPPPPVDLLPYHRLGVDKYERVRRDYRLRETRPPSSDRIAHAVAILKAAGLKVTVRGEPNGND